RISFNVLGGRKSEDLPPGASVQLGGKDGCVSGAAPQRSFRDQSDSVALQTGLDRRFGGGQPAFHFAPQTVFKGSVHALDKGAAGKHRRQRKASRLLPGLLRERQRAFRVGDRKRNWHGLLIVARVDDDTIAALAAARVHDGNPPATVALGVTKADLLEIGVE